MSENPLNIIANDDLQNKKFLKNRASQSSKRTIAKATFDRMWLQDKDQFNPLLTALGRDRVEKTELLIDDALKFNLKTAADLGSGSGIFLKFLQSKGLSIDAVDISTIALDHLKKENLTEVAFFPDYIPHTTLDSDAYDLVLGLDLIAYLNKDEYRLFISELARLVKLDGFVMASTPIDIYSEDALEQFGTLAESEFQIEKWSFSYHKYFIQLMLFFKAPTTFVKASKNKVFFEEELKKRTSINKHLFQFNCSKIVSFFWRFVQIFTNPIVNFLKQNTFILKNLEKLCRFISSTSGISHAIFLGKRRRVFEHVEEDKVPIERKGKRQVWE